jgi:hypothetical protein
MADSKDLNGLLKGEPASTEPSQSDIAREMARKAAKLNPKLKGGDSTEKFIQNAQGMLQGKAPTTPSAPTSTPFAKAQNADHLLEMAQTQFQQDKRELESQISILQSKLNGLKGKYLNDVSDRLAGLDPNLGSPVTQEALKQKKPFLDLLGFTMAKFLERMRQTRK